MPSFTEYHLLNMNVNFTKNISFYSLLSVLGVFLVTIWAAFEKYIIHGNIVYSLPDGLNASEAIAACEWYPSKLLIFSGNVSDSLVYFSHFIPFFIALVVGIAVFLQKPKEQVNRIFFFMTIVFCTWVFADIVTWANERPDIIMFFWSFMFPVESLLFLGYIFFSYVAVLEKQITWKTILLFCLPFLPVLFFWGTDASLSSFTLTNCDREAEEGWMAIYLYAYEFFLFFVHCVFLIIGLKKNKDDRNKQKVILWRGFSLGILMLAMAAGSLISSLVDNWQIAQYSLLAMPIMLMVIGMLMTRYHNMGHSYHGIQISVIILIVLIGSLFLLPQFSVILFQLVLFVILIYVIVIGWQLYRSTKEQHIYQEKLQNLNTELIDAQEKLKALDASKNEFLSFATHQLRSPLTSLKWGLNAVSDGIKDKPDILQIVEQLRETAGNMIETVNDLLDISKIEQGGLVMSTEPIDLVQLLDQLSEEFRITAGTKQLGLTFTTDLPVAIISGDKTKLRQVFVNIIDNAIKYTSTGSITITLKYNSDGNNFVTDVTDTGPGISPEELVKLFEKFIRGNAGKSSKGGSGLGLYLGKRIIELHHGSISVTSPGLGKGSTFSVILPKPSL